MDGDQYDFVVPQLRRVRRGPRAHAVPPSRPPQGPRSAPSPNLTDAQQRVLGVVLDATEPLTAAAIAASLRITTRSAGHSLGVLRELGHVLPERRAASTVMVWAATVDARQA